MGDSIYSKKVNKVSLDELPDEEADESRGVEQSDEEISEFLKTRRKELEKKGLLEPRVVAAPKKVVQKNPEKIVETELVEEEPVEEIIEEQVEQAPEQLVESQDFVSQITHTVRIVPKKETLEADKKNIQGFADEYILVASIGLVVSKENAGKFNSTLKYFLDNGYNVEVVGEKTERLD